MAGDGEQPDSEATHEEHELERKLHLTTLKYLKESLDRKILQVDQELVGCDDRKRWLILSLRRRKLLEEWDGICYEIFLHETGWTDDEAPSEVEA